MPVSLIYVIGDAPANPNIHVVKTKRKYGSTTKSSIDDITQSLSDDVLSKTFIPHQFWGPKEIKHFGAPTTWDVQLERIKNFDDQGIKIPIYSFYLKSSLFKEKLS